MVRLARAAAVVLLALLGTVAAGAAPAHAAVLDVVCVPPSNNVTTFTPPLTMAFAPTNLVTKTIYKPCTSPVPNLVSGVFAASITLNDACPMVLQTFTVIYTITWNTGATSTLQTTHTASISGSTLTVNYVGTVISGLFTGSHVSEQQVGSAVDLLNCLRQNVPLKGLTSKVTLQISH